MGSLASEAFAVAIATVIVASEILVLPRMPDPKGVKTIPHHQDATALARRTSTVATMRALMMQEMLASRAIIAH
jgi:hypothetical protein